MVNKVILIGNLTKDPELKYTPQGTAVCNFSIACNERFKDRDGNRQEKVEYVNIVVWRQLAEICGKFLHKGKQIYIEGKLQTRKYQDRDGRDCYRTEVVADQMQMLGSKSDGGGQQQQYPQQQYQTQQAEPQPQPQQAAYNPAQPQPVQSPYRPQQGMQQEQQPVFNPDSEIPF